MSEIEKYTEEDNKFLKNAAMTAAGIVTVGAIAWGAGAVNNNEQGPSDIKEVNNVENYERVFNASEVVGDIYVEEDTNLAERAENVLEARFGDEYTADRKRTYDVLLGSAQQYNPQPGETYYIVQTDINPEAKDGSEYFVVDSEHVVATGTDSLPSPIIADGSQPN